jgi:hypothetical protein
MIFRQFVAKYGQFVQKITEIASKVGVLALKKVWIMEQGRVMGFLDLFSGNSAGGVQNRKYMTYRFSAEYGL